MSIIIKFIFLTPLLDILDCFSNNSLIFFQKARLSILCHFASLKNVDICPQNKAKYRVRIYSKIFILCRIICIGVILTHFNKIIYCSIQWTRTVILSFILQNFHVFLKYDKDVTNFRNSLQKSGVKQNLFKEFFWCPSHWNSTAFTKRFSVFLFFSKISFDHQHPPKTSDEIRYVSSDLLCNKALH